KGVCIPGTEFRAPEAACEALSPPDPRIAEALEALRKAAEVDPLPPAQVETALQPLRVFLKELMARALKAATELEVIPNRFAAPSYARRRELQAGLERLGEVDRHFARHRELAAFFRAKPLAPFLGSVIEAEHQPTDQPEHWRKIELARLEAWAFAEAAWNLERLLASPRGE
ncbi:MAG: hypothetical protein ACOCVG_00195, partial [Verrucomicrobiota bacterium]